MWPAPFDDVPVGPPAINPDLRLAWRVSDRILSDPRLAGESVGVRAQNGVVTLTGTVGSARATAVAADVARATPGVADVCNRLEPAAPGPFEQVVAQWSGERPDAVRLIRARRRRERLLKAAVLLAALSVVLLVLLPRLARG